MSHTEKALGITWNNLDILVFGVKEVFNVLIVNPTKHIFKVIASAYNPTGFLQPIWIKLKILF